MHIDISHILHQYGYLGMLFILLTEMIGIPFPAETSLTIAGVEWSQGVFVFAPLLLAAAVGNILGSSIAYLIGYYLGRPVILRYGRFIGITEERLKKAEVKFERHRHAIILFGKFITGVRVLIPYLAGINRMNFLVFSGINTFSSFVWAAFFLTEGRYLGLVWTRFHGLIEQHGVGITVFVCTLVSVIWVRKTVKRTRGFNGTQDSDESDRR